MVTADRVVAATVTYGQRYELVSRTVDAAIAAGADEVVVVSNGAGEAVLDRLRQRVGARLTGAVLAANEGSAGGFATAIELAAGRGAELVWLLDDDNVARPDALRRLLAHRERTGARALLAHRPTDVPQSRVAAGWTVAAAYGPAGSLLSFDLPARLAARVRRGPASALPESVPVPVPYGPYGGLLVETSLLAEVAGPRREMWLYEDDSEWTARLARTAPLLLCLDARVDDADGKWSEGTRGSGPARMLAAPDRCRRRYAVRNRAAFDASRARTPASRVRLALNTLAYCGVIGALGIAGRRTADAADIVRAIRSGRTRGRDWAVGA